MTTREHNDFLTRTGPSTAMGNLFRRYWIPALLAAEVPVPDCPPVRVKLLSERLLAFRDSHGRVGVIDEFCAHRGLAATKKTGCAARITAGNMTSPANASRSRPSRRRAASAARSS